MRHIFLAISFVLCSLVAEAQEIVYYTEDVSLTVNKETYPTETFTFPLEKMGNGKYRCRYENIKFDLDDGEIALGTIEVELDGKEVDGVVVFDQKKNVRVQKGDDPDVSFWMGPSLGSVPVTVKGRLDDDHFYAVIDFKAWLLIVPYTVHAEVGHPENVREPVTAIRSLGEETSARHQIYDLQGRPVQKDAKGIVITDGKKVVR